MQNGTCVAPGTFSNVGSGYASRRGRVARVANRRGARAMTTAHTHMSSAGIAYNCPPGQTTITNRCVPVSSSPYGFRTF